MILFQATRALPSNQPTTDSTAVVARPAANVAVSTGPITAAGPSTTDSTAVVARPAANVAVSTGPITAAGPSTSSMNSLTNASGTSNRLSIFGNSCVFNGNIIVNVNDP